jgi:type III secretion system YscD/HrpQ family protein
MQDRSGPYYILKVLSGPHLGAEVRLTAGDYRLGRDDSCDIVLSDRSLRGEHALIAIGPDGVKVQSLAGEVRIDHDAHRDAARLLPFFTVLGLGTTHVAIGPEADAWPDLLPPAAGTPAAIAAVAPTVAGAVPAVAEAAPETSPAPVTSRMPLHRGHRLWRGAARVAGPLVLLLVIGAGVAATRETLMVERGIELAEPLPAESQPTPRARVMAILQDEGITGGLDVAEDRRGRLVVQGHVDSSAAQAVLAERLKRIAEPVQLKVVAGDRMVETARDTLTALGYDLEVAYAGEGVLRLAGYVPEASDLQRALDIVQRDVAGLAGIRNQVLSDRAILSSLEESVRKADLDESIRLRLEADKKITARGSLQTERMPAWTTIQADFDRRYGRYLEIVSQVAETRRDQPLPGVQLNVRAVGFGGLPYVILGDGGKYLEGSVLQEGWTIQRIHPREIVLSKGGQLYVHEL